MTVHELQGPSEALLAGGSQAKLLWFQEVLHIHKHTSRKVFVQLNTKEHMFAWDQYGTDGFGSALTQNAKQKPACV